ncbi:MAG: thioredoxin family protein [Gammaproteobacteria bacterium]|nr:thioredoxin family protein [Gammaproteobacteria bacterium]
MNVKIIATRSCNHRPNIEKELKELGVDYKVLFVEEHPNVVAKYSIRHSPKVMIDEEIVCRGQPCEDELKTLLNLK